MIPECLKQLKLQILLTFFLANALSLLFLSGCGIKEMPQVPTNPEEPMDTTYCLDFQESPTVTLPLVFRQATAALSGLASLEMATLKNPDKYPIQISIALINAEVFGANPQPIGKYSLFPVDNPSNYVFDLNQHLTDRQNWSGTQVLLRLTPTREDINSAQVQVCLRAVLVE